MSGPRSVPLSEATALVLEACEWHEQIPAKLINPRLLPKLEAAGAIVVNKAGMAKLGPTAEKLLEAWHAVLEFRKG